MRNSFLDELGKLAKRYNYVALIVGDLGFSVVEGFAGRFPDRFINAGVAEQNMTGLAAGMASEGYHVFTYSIANFPTFRCAEQIRNDVDYHKLPVTVVAVGGGLAYGALGYSHHAVQDYALIRCMPNMLIASPGDPMEVRACTRYLVENPQPSYLRLQKNGEPSFHSIIPKIEPGKWLKIHGASDSKIAVISTGAALMISEKWRENGFFKDADIYTLPLWGMNVKHLQAEQVANYERVIVVEDHLQDGGFGSWLLESMPNRSGLRDKIEFIYLDAKVCGIVGSQAYMNKIGGLTDKPPQ